MAILLYCFKCAFVCSILILFFNNFFSSGNNFIDSNLILFLVFLLFLAVNNFPNLIAINFSLILLLSYPASPNNILLFFNKSLLLFLKSSNWVFNILLSLILPEEQLTLSGIPLISLIIEILQDLCFGYCGL